MKKMTKKERKAYVKEMIRKRSSINKKINRLNKERRIYVEREMKKNSKKNTLDSAIIETVRKQAVEKNFNFK